MWMGIFYTIYVLNCLILIFFVLLQQSKGGGLAGAFGGGGGSDTLFGYTSMQKIGHYTIYAAVSFMLLSLLIANYPYQPKTDSVVPFVEGAATAPVESAPPAQPAGQAAAPQAEGAPAPDAPVPGPGAEQPQ